MPKTKNKFDYNKDRKKLKKKLLKKRKPRIEQ